MYILAVSSECAAGECAVNTVQHSLMATFRNSGLAYIP